MKLTKKIIADLAKAYRCTMEVSILNMQAPLRYITQYIAENIRGYGTASDEKVCSRADYRRMIIAGRQQSKGKPFKAKILTPYQPWFSDETTAQFQDEIRVQVGNGKDKHTIHLWMSTVFKFKDGRWQLVLFHGSMPDAGSSSADTFHLTEAERKLKELELVVMQRTQELETKNRELKIEGALERIRAKAMSMYKSSDLSEAASIVFDELTKLGISASRAGIGIIDELERSVQFYSNTPAKDGSNLKLVGSITMKGHKEFENQYTYWKKKQNYFKALSGKSLQSYYNFLSKGININRSWISTNSIHYGHWLMFSDGFLFAWNDRKYTAYEIAILDRFKSVIEITFRRYFDLQKAEAQTREAQIQLALERVRARTMAMHKSDELKEVISLVLAEIRGLDILAEHAGFYINYKMHDDMHIWLADPNIDPYFAILPYFDTPTWNSFLEAKANGTTLHTDQLDFKQKNKFYKSLFKLFSIPEEAQQFYMQCKGLAVSTVLLDTVGLYIENFSGIPYTEEENKILIRFGKVFQQTYTRFLDLQKAEAQAREAKIEAALEKVRSRSLAMHKSDELQEVIKVVLERITELGITMDSANINTPTKDRKSFIVWVAAQTHEYAHSFFVPWNMESTIWRELIESHESSADYFAKSYSRKDKDAFLRELFKHSDFKNIPDERKSLMTQSPAYGVSYAGTRNSSIQVISYSGKTLSPDEAEVLKRFAHVFEQCYIRFQDLEKAEAQTREAQIEAALEKIRSRSLAMFRSEDLKDVIKVVFEKLNELKVIHTTVAVQIFDQTTRNCIFWPGNSLHDEPPLVNLPYDEKLMREDSYLKDGWNAMLKGENIINKQYSLEQKNKFFNYVFANNDFVSIPAPIREFIAQARQHVVCLFVEKNSGLFVDSFDGQFYSDDQLNVLKRTARVFEQAYTRFLDLQKAEAQAREAQIEAALERVRSKTMAMQRSEDMREVVKALYAQLTELGFKWGVAAITIMDSVTGDIDWWMEGFGAGYNLPEKYHVPNFDHRGHREQIEHWKQGIPYAVVKIGGTEKKAYDKYYFYQTDFARAPENTKQLMMQQEAVLFSMAFMQYGALLWSPSPITDEQTKILQRFAKVFEQTYTRFLDLQKAEAQAREAQIEAALERVRSKTMAMHSSEDVGETVAAMFTEFVNLGIRTNRCGILIFNDETSAEVWTARANPEGKATLIIGRLFLHIHNLFTSVYKVWQNKEAANQYELIGDDLVSYYEAINNSKFYPTRFDLDKLPTKEFHSDFFFAEGAVFAFTNEPIAEEYYIIFKRFAGVFGQTYRRYLDLQKAEAQAREAQIEASLERVRARTMAMQRSEELAPTVKVLFDQFRNLQEDKDLDQMNRGFITTINEQKKYFELWVTEIDGTEISKSFVIDFNEETTGKFMFEAWQAKQSYLIRDLQGETLNKWLDYLTGTGFKVASGIYGSGRRVNTFMFYSQGFIGITSSLPLSNNNIQLLERFAKVFEQTYTRFLDLQKAEAQAREAVKQSSLDRIRGEIASMRTTKDLERITPLVWKELTTLNIPFVRCGVFIMDEPLQQIHTFLSTPDGKAIAAFHLPYEAPGRTREILASWMNKQVYITHWDEVAFSELGDLLVQQGAVPSKDAYLNTVPPGGIHLHCLPFMQGMLYVGNFEKLKENDILLLQSVADAFATAYARYEDFNRLEAAKQQIEKTLTDLKQTQTQLIQSEKMASLGELTAGIAHEIQNPLNFVNNFSEVSTELIDEMNAELAKGDVEEAKAISIDLKQNLEKINHHGKRAGDIVKGMLQHSRTSSGQKEPTDINALCDEYLRLAYHGYRAKDKSFNAKFEMLFDKSLPKVNVIAQDFGRVVLNLINNAFYAVNEKFKVESQKSGLPAGQAGYEPMVTVSTSVQNGKIEIRVSDNGNGIPDLIKEKIFQPFFTTKPTGQGTGLGLSLSYDIVKAHGGELKVETKEGEGSEFIILLSTSL